MQEAKPMKEKIGGGENESLSLHPIRRLFWDTVFFLYGPSEDIWCDEATSCVSFPKAVACSVVLLFICFPSFPVSLPSSFSSLLLPSHGSRIVHPIKHQHVNSGSCSLFWGALSKKDPN